jgi:hypothetical protein
LAALPDLSNQTAIMAIQRSAPLKLKEIFTNWLTILQKGVIVPGQSFHGFVGQDCS